METTMKNEKLPGCAKNVPSDIMEQLAKIANKDKGTVHEHNAKVNKRRRKPM